MAGAFMYAVLWITLYLFRHAWWRWSIEGLENLPPRGSGMIVAANHLSWTDIHIIGASLPYSHRLSWLAKAELFQKPLAIWWLNAMEAIPVQRGKRDVAALYASQNAVLRGAWLLIFLEGHRSRTGGLQEGRSGAVRLAVRTGSPIIPLAVCGTEHGFWGAMRGKPIRVRVGEPYHPAPPGAHLSASQLDELTDELMLKIAALLPEQYWGVYRERMGAMPNA